jgi:exopolysaccharide biosynthesis polyprenyl glycosylphosphotransferase
LPGTDRFETSELPIPAPQRGRPRDRAYRRSLSLADLAVVVAAGWWSFADVGDEVLPGVILLAIAFLGLAKLGGLYDGDALVLRRGVLDEVPALAQLGGIAVLITLLVSDSFWGSSLGPRHTALLWVLIAAGTTLTRTAVRVALRRGLAPERCLVLGNHAMAESLAQRLNSSSTLNAEVVLRLPLLLERSGDREGRDALQGGLDEVMRQNAIERVIVAPDAGDADDEVLDAIRRLESAGIRISVAPRMLEVVGASMALDDVDGIALLGVPPYALGRSSAFIKRSFDLVAGSILLLILSPLFAVVAVAIKLDSRGPVFFRQLRTGRDGRPFRMFKFRTMRTDAEEMKDELRDLNEAAGLFKIANDPRVTGVGGRLRKTSIDELVQLVDVVRGTMSLVGPRPLVTDEDRLFEGWERWRYHLRPGITGPWQILGSTRVPLEEMVKLDYLYCANWSLWGDVKILLRTISYLLRRESGEHLSTKR